MHTRILLISDGRPGHVNLSEGIAAALGRRRQTTIKRLTVRRGRWPGPVTALITRLTSSPALALSTIYGLSVSQLPEADIVISAGAETLAANIAAAKILGADNIFYGSLRQFRPSDFSLILTSYPAAQTARNIVQTLKPSALDPDTLQGADGLPGGQRKLGLLVGGPTTGIRYDDEDWGALEGLICDAHASAGVRWIVSNSRRTPEPASEMLRRLAGQDDGPVSALIDVVQPDAPSLADLLANVDGVVCTADSSSMISEVIWARRPLICIEPRVFSITPNEAAYRAWLMQEGWARAAGLHSMVSGSLLDLLGQVSPRTENSLDALADLLDQRLHALDAQRTS